MAGVELPGRKLLPRFKLFGTVIDSDDTPQKKKPPPAQPEKHNRDEAEPAKTAAAALPCPRCKSRETKFCYFNNYNVNQPRHFCKACHRYWTAGGALRNVPANAERRRNRVLARGAGAGSPEDCGEVDQWVLRRERMPPAAAAEKAETGAGEAR